MRHLLLTVTESETRASMFGPYRQLSTERSTPTRIGLLSKFTGSTTTPIYSNVSTIRSYKTTHVDGFLHFSIPARHICQNRHSKKDTGSHGLVIDSVGILHTTLPFSLSTIVIVNNNANRTNFDTCHFLVFQKLISLSCIIKITFCSFWIFRSSAHE